MIQNKMDSVAESTVPDARSLCNLRLRAHVGSVQRVSQSGRKIRFLLIKEGLPVGHVPGMKEPHLFDSDPLCRAIDEHFVAADRKFAPATFMLRHVLIRVAAGWIRIVTPASLNLHYGIGGERPGRPGSAELHWAGTRKCARRVHPVGDAAEVLVA